MQSLRRSTMFRLRRKGKGRFFFDFLYKGRVLLQSYQTYASLHHCEMAVNTVKSLAGDKDKYLRLGAYFNERRYYTLMAKNGRPMTAYHYFTSDEAMQEHIETVQAVAPNADTVDTTYHAYRAS